LKIGFFYELVVSNFTLKFWRICCTSIVGACIPLISVCNLVLGFPGAEKLVCTSIVGACIPLISIFILVLGFPGVEEVD
jgi:hypothetical protein